MLNVSNLFTEKEQVEITGMTSLVPRNTQELFEY